MQRIKELIEILKTSKVDRDLFILETIVLIAGVIVTALVITNIIR